MSTPAWTGHSSISTAEAHELWRRLYPERVRSSPGVNGRARDKAQGICAAPAGAMRRGRKLLQVRVLERGSSVSMGPSSITQSTQPGCEQIPISTSTHTISVFSFILVSYVITKLRFKLAEERKRKEKEEEE